MDVISSCYIAAQVCFTAASHSRTDLSSRTLADRIQATCRAFFDYVDMLLDENELLGPGQNCQAELRPLALSMLAELVHHLRNELKLPQLVRIISLFAR